MSNSEEKTKEQRVTPAAAEGDDESMILQVGESGKGYETAEGGANKTKKTALTVLVLLAIACGLSAWYVHSQSYEDTDDAQVDGHIAPVSARIAGTVTSVHVQDNDRVQAGQPLVDLDTRTAVANLEQSRAQLAQANAQLKAQQPDIPIIRTNNTADLSSDDATLAQAVASAAAAESDRDQAVARLKDAQAQSIRDQAQLKRYKQLYDSKEASREDYEKYSATAASSSANVAAAQAAVSTAAKVIDQRNAQVSAQRSKRGQDIANAPQQLAIRQANVLTQQANADSAKAFLDKATLDLSFAKVVAPVAGIVTQRSAEIGSRVAEGTQMLMIVQIDDLWVTANFKETQLRRLKPGQKAKIHVDALNRDFDGYVDSMPAITGSRSSVLPPENATGNYVKVVQRLPVRIRFNAGQEGLAILRPGMSVEPHVYLR